MKTHVVQDSWEKSSVDGDPGAKESRPVGAIAPVQGSVIGESHHFNTHLLFV